VATILMCFTGVTASPERRQQRLCLAVLVLNIAWALAALASQASVALPEHGQGSNFERQKPQLSDWPSHSHGDGPQA
jgi:hypothetical protein